MPKKRVVVPSYLTWTKLAGRWRTASLTVCSWSDGAKSVRNMDLLTENSFFHADFTTDRAPAARGRWACSRSATRRRREDPCSFAKGAPRHSTPYFNMMPYAFAARRGGSQAAPSVRPSASARLASGSGSGLGSGQPGHHVTRCTR